MKLIKTLNDLHINTTRLYMGLVVRKEEMKLARKIFIMAMDHNKPEYVRIREIEELLEELTSPLVEKRVEDR